MKKELVSTPCLLAFSINVDAILQAINQTTLFAVLSKEKITRGFQDGTIFLVREGLMHFSARTVHPPDRAKNLHDIYIGIYALQIIRRPIKPLR